MRSNNRNNEFDFIHINYQCKSPFKMIIVPSYLWLIFTVIIVETLQSLILIFLLPRIKDSKYVQKLQNLVPSSTTIKIQHFYYYIYDRILLLARKICCCFQSKNRNHSRSSILQNLIENNENGDNESENTNLLTEGDDIEKPKAVSLQVSEECKKVISGKTLAEIQVLFLQGKITREEFNVISSHKSVITQIPINLDESGNMLNYEDFQTKQEQKRLENEEIMSTLLRSKARRSLYPNPAELDTLIWNFWFSSLYSLCHVIVGIVFFIIYIIAWSNDFYDMNTMERYETFYCGILFCGPLISVVSCFSHSSVGILFLSDWEMSKESEHLYNSAAEMLMLATIGWSICILPIFLSHMVVPVYLYIWTLLLWLIGLGFCAFLLFMIINTIHYYVDFSSLNQQKLLISFTRISISFVIIMLLTELFLYAHYFYHYAEDGKISADEYISVIVRTTELRSQTFCVVSNFMNGIENFLVFFSWL